MIALASPGGEHLAFHPQPHSFLGRPHRTGNAQAIFHFNLPLNRQGGRCQDQNGPIIKQGTDQGTGGHGQCFANPHLIGKEKAGLAIDLPMFQKHGDKGQLPRLELFAAPVDGGFGHGRRWNLHGFEHLHGDFQPVGHPVNFRQNTYNGPRKRTSRSGGFRLPSFDSLLLLHIY